MESTISGLAEELLGKFKSYDFNVETNDLVTHIRDSLPNEQRLLVGLSGIPASGKSSLAHAVVRKVNEIYSKQNENVSPIAILVGLDGWHFSRAVLTTFPDPQEAFARRGAHWTFDGNDYVRFVLELRSKSSDLVMAPSFSHSLKDPVMDDIRVEPYHRIVLLEGLYVFLSLDPWKTAGALLDERWFVEVDLPEATTRIVKRHVETGVTATLEEAKKRAEENDFPNGEFVAANMLLPTKWLKSVDDPSIAI